MEFSRVHSFSRQQWYDNISWKFKVYSLGIEDKKIVDPTFDRMQAPNRLDFTDVAMPFSYAVFVVRTTKDGVKEKPLQ
jgi:hypothetical protein